MIYEWPTITADTPIEDLRRIHKEIWDYVVANGKKPNTQYVYECVLCEYAYICARQVTPNSDRSWQVMCNYCPSNLQCRNAGSLFSKWTGNYDPIIKRFLAKHIRDTKIDMRFVKNTHPVIEE